MVMSTEDDGASLFDFMAPEPAREARSEPLQFVAVNRSLTHVNALLSGRRVTVAMIRKESHTAGAVYCYAPAVGVDPKDRSRWPDMDSAQAHACEVWAERHDQ